MSKADLNLIFRTDASREAGTGHLMRCLALGQAWQDSGGRAIFISSCDSPALTARLRDERFELVTLDGTYPDPRDAETTLGVLREHPRAWLVCDGYHFDHRYHQMVKGSGHNLLVIDDNAHLDHYYADIVLNQNLHANRDVYSSEADTRFLMGTRFALLRREFRQWSGWNRETPARATRVLVSLGGSDPDNATAKVIEAVSLTGLDGLETVAVVGGGSPYYQELLTLSRDLGGKVKIVRNATDMPALMAWADVAVAAGGSTSWELAFMGLPSLVLVLAENQLPVAERLEKESIAVNLGWHHRVSPREIAARLTELLLVERVRIEMSERGRGLVDGQGASRVVMAVRGDRLRLRKAADQDCRMLWEWANTPEVRKASFSSEEIPWEEHVRWFAAKLQNPDCCLFIGLDGEDRPVGQVRLEMTNDAEAEINVSVRPDIQGAGYGSELIRMAGREMFRLFPVVIIHSFIKPFNQASIKAFSRAGFCRVGEKMVKGNPAEHYIMERHSVE